MDSVAVLGNVALVCTVVCNLSGLPLCVDFFKKKSTAGVSVTPFIAGTICNGLWLMYSRLTGDQLLQQLNIMTTSMQLFYVTSFYINTAEKAKVRKLVFMMFAFLVSIFTHANYIADHTTGLKILGLAASAASIFACAAPLENMPEVIRTKNSQSLPFPIVLGSFIVTTLWFAYGLLVGDTFIQVPNCIGSFLSALQLILIVTYPAKPSLKKES